MNKNSILGNIYKYEILTFIMKKKDGDIGDSNSFFSQISSNIDNSPQIKLKSRLDM